MLAQLFAEHIAPHNETFMWALALVGLIISISIIVIVIERRQEAYVWLLAVAVAVLAAALVINWWPK